MYIAGKLRPFKKLLARSSRGLAGANLKCGDELYKSVDQQIEFDICSGFIALLPVSSSTC